MPQLHISIVKKSKSTNPRLREGFEATETEFFIFRGKLLDMWGVVDFAERRAYIEMVVEYGGHHQKKAVEPSQSDPD
jgi:hypothetical protein